MLAVLIIIIIIIIIIIMIMMELFENFDVLYDEQSLWYTKFLYYCYKHWNCGARNTSSEVQIGAFDNDMQ